VRNCLPRFGRTATLYMASQTLASAGFVGIYSLLRILLLLRLGFGPEYIGWTNAAGAIAYSAMGIPSGLLGQRFGQRRVSLVGGVIIVVCYVATPLMLQAEGALSRAMPLVMQVLMVGGWALRSINLLPALLASATPETRDQITFANQGIGGIGMFVGTLLGGVLPGLFGSLLGVDLEQPLPYALAITTGALLGLTSLVPLWMVREPSQTMASEVTSEAAPDAVDGERVGRFPLLPVALVVVHVVLQHGGWGAATAFYGAYLDEALGVSTATIGGIASVGQLLGIGAAFAAPFLARRRGNGAMLTLTTAGLTGALMALTLLPHWVPAAMSQVSISAFMGIWLPTLQLFTMQLVAPEWRSLSYGVLSMAMGGAYALATLAGGYVVAGQGYRALFGYGIAFALAATALIAWTSRHRDAILARSP